MKTIHGHIGGKKNVCPECATKCSNGVACKLYNADGSLTAYALARGMRQLFDTEAHSLTLYQRHTDFAVCDIHFTSTANIVSERAFHNLYDARKHFRQLKTQFKKEEDNVG